MGRSPSPTWKRSPRFSRRGERHVRQGSESVDAGAVCSRSIVEGSLCDVPVRLAAPEIYGGTNHLSDVTDDLDEIVARYAERELTLEEAVERADGDERAFKRTLSERDIEIRPYPITRDIDEIVAFLAREMIVPIKASDDHLDDYGLSKAGHAFLQASGEVPGEVPPPPPAIQVIEKLGITSDEECERARKRIEDHPEWADGIPDEPPDYLSDLRE